jgi:hypothetical protein
MYDYDVYDPSGVRSTAPSFGCDPYYVGADMPWWDPPSSAEYAVGWEWPWVALPIAPNATMHTQTDPYSLFTLPKAIEQFYVHQYVIPEAKKVDKWLSSGEFTGAPPALVAVPIDIPNTTDEHGNPYPWPAVMVEASMPSQMKMLIVWTFHSLRHGEQAKTAAKLHNLMVTIACLSGTLPFAI